MSYFRKAAAFAACLLICLGSTVCPVMGSLADDEDTVETAEILMADEDEDENVDKVYTSGDYRYKKTKEGNAVLAGCATGGEGDELLVVPTEIEGMTVTEIDASAFTAVQAEKIVIPATVEYISSENPFAPCDNLKEIEVEEGNADYCSVDGVLFSKDMKRLMSYPMKKSDKSYAIPDGVETIGVAAFYNTELSEVTIPSTVTTINRHAFSFMKNLTALDMSGADIATIEPMTFVESTSLEEVKFSESTTEIGIGAFMNCEKLAQVELPPHLMTVGQSAFQGTALQKIRIPSSVKEIGYSAFGYDKDENTVKDFVIIGDRGSAAQTYATDKDSEYDYANNFSFQTTSDADLQEEIEALGIVDSGKYSYAVQEDGSAILVICTATDGELTVPDEIDGHKLTSIFKYAFARCSSEKIILPETVETIGAEAFSEKVESITIPGGCKSIEDTSQFLICTSLKEINVTEGDGEYASIDGVLYSSDKTLLITYPAARDAASFKTPAGVDDIADNAFCYNKFLKEVDLSGVKYIGSDAFEDCTELTSVKHSKELEYVGRCAFTNCTSLKSVHLYEKLEDIGDFSFGFLLDESLISDETVEYPFTVDPDFVIYTSEGSVAHQYAKACGITVKTDTSEIGGKELSKPFIYTMCGIGGAVVLGAVGIVIGKSASKKKGKKENGNENK